MARKGRFGEQAPTDYAGNVLKQINQMNTTGDTAAEPGTTDGTTPKTRTPRTRPAPLTAEQIAADPVLSGKLSYDQARINYIRYTQALNKMPLATTTGKKYAKQLAASRKALAKLGGNAQEAERQFANLGGTLTGTGNAEGSNFGGNAQAIMAYWRNAGMEEKGQEIVSKLRGYDQYGNDLPGGIDTSKNINYAYGKEYQTRMQSNTKGLNTLQAARLTKLKNLKQGGATLGPKQLANLKKLRALAKG